MRLKFFLSTSLLFLVSLSGHAQDKMLIAAAADLRFAMDSVISAFSQNNPGRIDVTYGSSGKLTEQILNSAPFDLFFSADIAFPEKLQKQNKTASDIYPYARGHLVIWSKKYQPQQEQVKSLLDPGIKKIAIANPSYAPYGMRAVEALEYYELLEPLKSKLVYGENISQTAQFVATGAADIGIIALSLALSPNMKKEKGNYFLIPESGHQPLTQGAVITRKGEGNKLAASFFEFVQSDTAISILDHFGFSRP